MTDTVSNVLGILTILINGVTVVALFDMWYYHNKNESSNVLAWIKTYPLEIVFVFSFVAMIASLFYSNIAGFTPCTLCWYQRIAMYPMVFIAGAALYWNDLRTLRYTWVLSLIGAFLAAYHYLLQIGVITFSTCSVAGYSITCSDRFFLRYGYITIPMMALSVFVVIAITSYLSYPRKGE
ncbi:MAG: disulfide bond formation protein B [bacterium]|nr:disulfide bond formation protein B [bacterium]